MEVRTIQSMTKDDKIQKKKVKTAKTVKGHEK